MRMVALLVLATAALVVAEEDLTKTTSSKTNGQRVVTVDTYLRAGVTNLTIKTIERRDESKTYRIQSVYRHGRVVLDITELGFGRLIQTYPGCDCYVGTHFDSDGRLDHVNLMDTNVMTLDHFSVTNDILVPIAADEIRKSNIAAEETKKFFAPEHLKQVSPEQFGREAAQLKKKLEHITAQPAGGDGKPAPQP